MKSSELSSMPKKLSMCLSDFELSRQVDSSRQKARQVLAEVKRAKRTFRQTRPSVVNTSKNEREAGGRTDGRTDNLY